MVARRRSYGRIDFFFCDADLKGLTVEHVKNIVEPVVRGDLAMNVGIRDRGALMMKITPHLPPSAENAHCPAIF